MENRTQDYRSGLGIQNQAQTISQVPPSPDLAQSQTSSSAFVNSANAVPSSTGLKSSNEFQPKKPSKKRGAIIVIAILLLLLLAGAVWSGYWLINRSQQEGPVASEFESIEIPLDDFLSQDGLNLIANRSLSVNGLLQANGGLLVTPSAQPSSAQAGQIYYDQTSNELAYYNGTEFIAITSPEEVQVITAGTGLSLTGGSLTNTGVVSLQGVAGAVSLTAGTGIAIDGLTISSTVTSGGAGTVSSPGGTNGRIAKFTGAQTIADSILFESGSVLTVEGNLVTTAGVNIGSADTTGDLLVLDTKTNAGDPVGVNGGMYYNSNAGKLRCFEGGAWADCISAGASNVFVQGGNSFGGAATLGTNDGFDLNIERGGVTQLTVGNGNVTLASNVDLLLQGATAYISNPQATVTSEVFGLNASTNDARNVVVGNSASVTGFSDSVAVGYLSTGRDNSITIGAESTCTGNACVAMGFQSSAAFTSTALGTNAVAGNDGSIALGRGATTTAANQMVVGSSAGPISQVVVGNGVTNASPTGFTLQGTGGSGANIGGANVTLAAGRSTGSANGGNLNFQISAPGGAGSSLNALATVFSLQGTNGSANFINAINSTQAFNVENAAGANLLTADTTNNRVGINLGGSSTPSLASGTGGAEINGALRISGIGSTTWDNYTTPTGATVLSKLNIVNQTMNPFGQIVALGLTSGSSDSARGLSIFDARTVAHQPSLAVFSPDENSMVGFSWNGSNSAATVQTNSNPTGNTDSVTLQSGNVTAGNGSSGEVIVSTGSIQGGTGGSTGLLTLQSGNGAGTNSSSGNVILDSGTRTGSGVAGTISIATTNASALTLGRSGLTTNNAGTLTLGQLGTTDTSTFLCRNSGNILAACATTGAGAAFVQGGNNFGAIAVLGTNDAFDLQLERGGVTQLTVGNGNVTLASNVDLLLQGSSAYISNPQGQTNSEAFGLNAAVAGPNSLAVGRGANTDGSGDSTAIGTNALSGVNGTSLGFAANAQAHAIAVGGSSYSDSGGLALGANSNAAFVDSIAMGYCATTTAMNQMVIGSGSSCGSSYINRLIVGNGATEATPVGFTLQGTSGNGANVTGATIAIAGGQGTGTGNGGGINLQISAPGGAGSTLNTLTTVASLSGTNGAATFQNATNSANALRILNAAGTGEHVGVDTTDSILRLLANNTGHLSGTGANWNTGTALPAARCCGAAVTVNGYVYQLGGADGGGGSVATVSFARTNSDGSVGSWAATTSLPVAVAGTSAAVYNGYIYVHGGTSNANDSRDIYYAKPNVDGTITSWTTQNDPTNMIDHIDAGMATYNGYLYISGGEQHGAIGSRDVFYGKINADGSVPTFTEQTNLLPAGDYAPAPSLVANGYLYVFGSGNYDKFFYGRINANGSVGTIAEADGNTVPRRHTSIAVMNGYIYAIGGGTSGLATVEYAPLLSTGNIAEGSFVTDTTLLPAARSVCPDNAPVVNNYIYFYGCGNGSFTAQTSVYYASGSRVKVGAALDLVGFSGEGLSEGGTGGQLTAGNTYVNGSLSVTGNTTLKDGLGVEGPFNLTGTQTIQTSTNSTTAFKVIDSGNTDTVFNVDTTNRLVGIGTNAPTSKLHVVEDLTAGLVLATFRDEVRTALIEIVATGSDTPLLRSGSADSLNFAANGSSTAHFSISTAGVLTVGTSDTTGALLVLDTKTSAGDPTGINGGMYYNSNSGKLRCYENSTWKNCLGPNETITFNGTNGDGSASLWTDMPAALTEFWGRDDSRMQYDLTDGVQARLLVNVDTAAAASAELRIQYSTDQSSWNYLDGGTGPSVVVDSTGLKVSSWVNITAGAKSDVFLRVVGINSDGAADPRFGIVQLQIR